MSLRRSLLAVALAGVALLALPGAWGEGPSDVRVEIATPVGKIVARLDPRAPVTTANFLRYVDAGLLDATSFYRVVNRDNDPQKEVKIEVIQGGRGEAADDGKGFPAIRHETTRETGLRHVDGALSMARLEPGTASSEFFICVGDQPELDFGGGRNPDGQGFAVFGLVVEGMDVVRRIHESPREAQRLSPPVEILTVRRLPAASPPGGAR